ncbi:unnamed protein product [Rodentolepis nana]|uniref:SET domain-containing protein n=1 Tax=Rodentolepis nana TaxID=102285 RepID=A0A3P7VDP3_RODNA|nr:unnamed protein product [Rodentolepis nana]
MVKRYFELSTKCLDEIKETRNVIEEFGKLDTDFERVCYFLKQLRMHSEAREAVKPNEVQKVKEELARCNGKSDKLSKLFLTRSKHAKALMGVQFGLHYTTLAVFYAKSLKSKSVAFANRAIFLYEIGLIDEAIADARKAIEGPLSRINAAKICVCLGNCYKHRGRMPEATTAFSKALQVLENTDPDFTDYIKIQAIDQLREIDQLDWNDLTYSCSKCRFSKPKLSELKKALWNENFERDTKEDNTSCKLLASNGTLALKNTKSNRGWTLEVTKHVKPGEVLAIEKCYATSFSSRWTSQCYSCHQLCHNLIPCKHCPMVGFCCKKCAHDAVKRDFRRKRCINKHVYDCKGILPCILLDEYASWSGFNSIIGCDGTTQLACACISNTDPSRLLDYICSVGDYQGGRGHQAFAGEKYVREVPPQKIDASDYSSVGFLTTCSEKKPTEHLLQSTIASIFLTYCLYIGGYPMEWCNIDLYTPPSSENRPKCIPASWVAACILYHVLSADINAFNMDLAVGQSQSVFSNNIVNIGSMLFSTISLINHSCNPSAFLTMSKQGFGCLFASKALSPGSEIFLQYAGNNYDNSKERRQTFLRSFHFECDCEACINDWTYDKDDYERIICPECETSFPSNLDVCSFCSSGSGKERYQKLLNEDFEELTRCLLERDINSETYITATNVLTQAQSLIEQPSNTIKVATKMLIWLMMNKYGNWVSQPWR